MLEELVILLSLVLNISYSLVLNINYSFFLELLLRVFHLYYIVGGAQYTYSYMYI